MCMISVNLIGVCLGEDQRTNIIKYMFGRDWTMFSKFN
jgi:hypothetical protein